MKKPVLCVKNQFKKKYEKLTSDSDSPPPITYGQSFSHKKWLIFYWFAPR
jgi:hypothetical protein